jgi:hypothetical protein
MLRGVVPRFRIAREGGVRRAATGYGVAPAFGKGAVSASLLPSMRLGHCGVAGRMDRRGSRGVRDCDRSYPCIRALRRSSHAPAAHSCFPP